MTQMGKIMDRRTLLKLAAGSAAALPALGESTAFAAVPSLPTAASGAPSPKHYFSDDYRVSMSLFCFNQNIDSWLKNRTKGAPPLTTSDAITWAKSAGFDAVDITAYYFPGYDTHTMPTLPTDQIVAFAQGLRAQCEHLNLRISGTGAFNDFADPDPARRALDIQRVQFWTDIAAVMGAPAIRVFSGVVPVDIDAAGGWAAVTQSRIVPALQQVTSYAATKGVRVLLQNHGDMTATAGQTIQMLQWVGDPNISIIDDTGYFRPFLAGDGASYNYYADIDEVVPYSASIQVKRKPGGETDTAPMDYDRLFTGLRLSNYHDFMPLERLWAKTDPDNPKVQPTPPFDQVASFLAEVKAGLARTKHNPFTALANSVGAFGRAGAVGHDSWHLLAGLAADAGHQYDFGHPALALQDMQSFTTLLTANPADVTPVANQALSRQASALLLAATDVFG
jgi:sugar phosphate isomerase/epimerase